MRLSGRAAVLIVVGALLVAACGDDDATPTTATTATPGGTATTTADGATTTTTVAETERPPLFEGLDGTVTLLTAESGEGTRPLLEWEEFPGADHYAVFLYAPSGAVYWSWAGRETSVHVGGEPQLREGASGPSVIEGMSWAVMAYDADLLPLAVSEQRPIAP